MISLKDIFAKIKEQYHLKVLKRRYFRYGKCLKCGCCCENIYIRHKGSVIKNEAEFEEIQKIDAYSFYKHISIIAKDDFGLVFSCDWFDKDKRICKNHKNRPSICRNYPSEDIFSFGAQLQDGCGFWFEPIEKFDKVFERVKKKPAKEFEMIEN